MNLDNPFISHSQHADDYIAWQMLGNIKSGLVVEVGAYDGIHLSNSYALENLGWKSVCIEANPKTFKYLVKNRPRASCISCAVVENNNIEQVEFWAEEIGVLSGISIDISDVEKRYKNRGVEFLGPDKIKVNARTLDNILKSQEISSGEIDLLSIDVEGYEMKVLEGFNISHYNPALLIIEANNPGQVIELMNYFKDRRQYLYLGSNRQNLFFILKDKINRGNLRNLNFDRYVAAKQYHPYDQKFAIQAVPPVFNASPELKEILKKNWFSKWFLN